MDDSKIDDLPSLIPNLKPYLGMSTEAIRLGPLMSPQAETTNIIDSIPIVFTSQSPTAGEKDHILTTTAPTRFSEQSPTSADNV